MKQLQFANKHMRRTKIVIGAWSLHIIKNKNTFNLINTFELPRNFLKPGK